MAKTNTQTKTEETQVTTPATKSAPTLSAEQVKKVQGLETKSAQIRYLSGLGIDRGGIVRAFKAYLNTDIRYQHVRNVLITPLKSQTK